MDGPTSPCWSFASLFKSKELIRIIRTNFYSTCCYPLAIYTLLSGANENRQRSGYQTSTGRQMHCISLVLIHINISTCIAPNRHWFSFICSFPLYSVTFSPQAQQFLESTARQNGSAMDWSHRWQKLCRSGLQPGLKNVATNATKGPMSTPLMRVCQGNWTKYRHASSCTDFSFASNTWLDLQLGQAECRPTASWPAFAFHCLNGSTFQELRNMKQLQQPQNVSHVK